MSSLAERLILFSQRMQAQYNNKIAPRLLPPGGGGGMMLIRASDAANSFGWAIPPQIPLAHFCDVSGQDTAPYQTSTAAPEIQFPRVRMNQKSSDADNLWDGTNNWYNVPETGLYLINATFRPPDRSDMRQYEFGFGCHTAQSDGGHFMWTFRPAASRFTAVYSRMVRLTQGQQVRMFVYAEYTNWESKISTAAMQIGMISKG